MADLSLDVNVDVKGDEKLDSLNRSLDTTEKKHQSLGAVSTGIFQGIGQAAAGAGIGLVKAGLDIAIDKVGDSITLASDKAEAASKVNNLFGESADVVTRASETAATTVALSSGAYLQAAGDLGNLTTNLGYTGAEAADMSVDMIALAADMGSFNNASTEDVTEAMGAAFRGETEPIRKFGVMLDDASVKAKAVELGLYDGIGAIDAHAKAEATWQLITEKTVAAQGDLAETADGFANQQKFAAARMDEAFTRIGDALLPLVNQIMPVLADVAVAVAEGIGDLVEAAGAWLHDNQDFVDSVVELGRVLWDLYTRYIGALIEILGELGYRIGGVIGLVVDLAGALIDTGSAIVSVLSGDFEGAAAAGERALDRLGSFAENVQRAMGDTGRKAADEALKAAQVTEAAAEESASGAINALAGGYAAGVPEVTAAAETLAEPIPEAVADAGTEAAQIAAQTPAQIASGLRSNRDAVGSAVDQLKTDIKEHIEPAKEIAKLEGLLSGKALTAGLKSTDPIVRAQADATVDTIETRLNELKGVGTTAGQTGAGAIPGGMSSKDPAVLAAARSTTAVVTTQFNTLESGSRIAAQTANLTLSTGLSAGTTAASNAGENVASAWGNALVRVIRGYRDDVGSAAAYATAPIRGYSPPKVGPLRDIDQWGENIGEAWLGGMERATGAVAVGASGAGGGAVYNVTVQVGVGDPVAIGRETVAAIQAFERSSGRDWRSSV